MTVTQRTMITLLKSAVTGDSYPLPKDFDLDEVVKLLKKHGLISMGYIGAVNCGIPKTEPVMQTMFVHYCRSAVVSQRQLDKAQEIFDAFDAAGIDYMPLKGLIMKHLYPSHELRPMGDADILIRVEQYDRIKPIMERLGFSEGEENEHELPWRCDDLYVELHKCLIPPSSQDLYSYFESGWRVALCDKNYRFKLAQEDEFVFLFCHFAKHFRGGGIGCRHVLDLWCYMRSHRELDYSYICGELDKLYLLEFYQNMTTLINAWFYDRGIDGRANFISNYIFQSGIWGNQFDHDLASNTKMYQTVGKVRPGKWGYFLQRVFPNFQTMSYQYPLLVKIPVLLPFIWVVRWFRILLQKPALLKRRFKMLDSRSDDKILEWEQKMSDVGLRYWHDSEK